MYVVTKVGEEDASVGDMKAGEWCTTLCLEAETLMKEMERNDLGSL